MSGPDQQGRDNLIRALSGLHSPRGIPTIQSEQESIQEPSIVGGTSEITGIIGELTTQYRSSVTRFNLLCKLRNGANINGQIKNSNTTDFENFGPNIELFQTYKEPGFRMIESITKNQDDHPSLMQSQFVCRAGKKENDREIASLYFFQDRGQIDSRTHCTRGCITFELPEVKMQSFLKDIRTYPDLLEQFYQSLYRDLDSKNGEPGLRRIPASGFYLLENSDLEHGGALGRYDTVGVGNFFQSIKDNAYFQFLDGPYGTGEKPTV